jgi:hypothetical protein
MHKSCLAFLCRLDTSHSAWESRCGPWLEGFTVDCLQQFGSELFGDPVHKIEWRHLDRTLLWYMCTRSLFVYAETPSIFSNIYVRWMGLNPVPVRTEPTLLLVFVRYFRGRSPVMIICLKDEDWLGLERMAYRMLERCTALKFSISCQCRPFLASLERARTALSVMVKRWWCEADTAYILWSEWNKTCFVQLLRAWAYELTSLRAQFKI